MNDVIPAIEQWRARGERVGEVLALAGRQVVEHDDVVAAFHQCIDEVRADEARSPGNQSPHAGRV